MQRRRTAISLLLACLAALALAACGDSSDDSSSPAGGSTAAGNAANAGTSIELPEGLKDGKLDVFADGEYPPFAYMEKGKMIGMEAELLELIAKKLGDVDVVYHDLQFDAMIPAIANGRGDVMVMGMADTEERQKTVDFIDLYKTRMQIVTRKGNPANLDINDVCGKRASGTTGSLNLGVVENMAKDCKAAGKPPLKVLAFTEASQAYLAVSNGRVDFYMMDPANAAYFVKLNPKYEVLPGTVATPGAKYTGWIIAKNNPTMRDALYKAISQLTKEGEWQKILSKWGVDEVGVMPPLVNGKPAPTS